MSEHSPGPWHARDDMDGNGYKIIRDVNGKAVAYLVLPANAPLIAAAPDLLSALKIRVATCYCGHENCQLCAIDKAIIASIEGVEGPPGDRGIDRE